MYAVVYKNKPGCKGVDRYLYANGVAGKFSDQCVFQDKRVLVEVLLDHPVIPGRGHLPGQLIKCEKRMTQSEYLPGKVI